MASLRALPGVVAVCGQERVGDEPVPTLTVAMMSIRYDPDRIAWPDIVATARAALEADPHNPHPVAVKMGGSMRPPAP